MAGKTTKAAIADAAIAYKHAEDEYGMNETAYESGEIGHDAYCENADRLDDAVSDSRRALFDLIEEYCYRNSRAQR